jgi:hypothetical protein
METAMNNTADLWKLSQFQVQEQLDNESDGKQFGEFK